MTHGQIVRISSVAWSEFLCGPVEESDKEIARTLLADIEPFTAADAELASEFFNVTGRRSRSHIDCMIAAHAVRRNAELATLNIKRFRRFPKLRLATNSGLSAK